MKLSSKARYGLKAALCLAENYNGSVPVPLPVFSGYAGVGEAYMEQIIALLKKAGVVESVRGVSGGYYLKKRPSEVRVGEVLRALEDGLEFIGCLSGPCSEGDGCRAHVVWNRIYDNMNLVLDSISLEDLLSAPKRYVYLDHSATTPLDREVLAKMIPYFSEKAGNASSQHGAGREAALAVDAARERVRAAINAAKANEIYFTSGGSESDNWAIKGAARANRDKGRHIITSAFEHPAVLNSLEVLKKEGFEVSYLKPSPEGYVSPEDLRAAIRPDTILVSVMYANNEIGTIQPVRELAAVAKERGILFHTDAVQAAGNVPIDVVRDGIDMLSMSAHKFYGPKGAGCLYIRNGVKCDSIMSGGEQESGRRAGTTNTPGIVGTGYALEKAVRNMRKYTKEISSVRDEFVRLVLESVPDVRYNGGRNRLCGNAHFSFRYVEGESILFTLDLAGICASSGSACSSGTSETSGTVLSIGVPPDEARGSVRFTFGRENTMEDARYAAEKLAETVRRLRAMSPLCPYAD